MNLQHIWLAALAACSSNASAMTGNEFLDLEFRNSFAALNYVTGLVDGSDTSAMLAAQASGGIFVSTRGCPGEKVTYGQMRDVALKALREEPKDRHFDASLLLIRSWKRAWPCPSK